jgi:hypothetical protein
LQIEERQRTYSALMNKADDYSRSISAELNDGGEKLGNPINLTPKSTSGLQTSPPFSERQLITAWPALSSTQHSLGIQAHSLVKPLSPSSSASASIAPALNPFVAPSPTPAKEEQPNGLDYFHVTRIEVAQARAPDTGDADSRQTVALPPLAGPNVMNVIVVAAECAPWSKTGMIITCIDTLSVPFVVSCQDCLLKIHIFVQQLGQKLGQKSTMPHTVTGKSNLPN